MSAGHKITIHIADTDLHQALMVVCQIVRDQGGQAYLVGGCVRDAALKLAAEDLDVEVFGVEAERLQAALAERFKLDLVGKSFGVIKLHGLAIDVGIPRREFKSGRGHKGFTIDSDPGMSIEQAAARRDYTINSIYYDPLNGNIEDPFNGLQDLSQRVLRHTSDQFSEDPLRVLRGAQFAARFELSADINTIKVCRNIGLEDLAAERIFTEWRKLLLLGKRPALGLEFLRECGWIDHFPELKAMIGLQQDPKWHPEGDAWIHTLLSLDAFAEQRIGEPQEDLIVGLAVLCHDFGKAVTTRFDGECIRSPGHDRVGAKLAVTFLNRLTPQKELTEQVAILVANHMMPIQLFKAGASVAAVRRLAARVGRIDRLVRVATADAMGRSKLSVHGFPAGDWLLEQAAALEVTNQIPTPFVQGRHLITLGLVPSPQFKKILAICYEAQLDGEFDSIEAGVDFAARLVAEYK